MKFTTVLIMLTMSATCAAWSDTVEKITTLLGRTYRGCNIVNVHPDGISFTHSNGAAKILFTDLPQPLRDKFGYDPAKAAAHEKKLADRRAAETKAREDRQKELAKALQLAQEMELARLRLQERQAAAMQIPASTGSFFPLALPVAGLPWPSYGTLPPLGAVHHSSGSYHRGRWIADGVYYSPFGVGYLSHFPSATHCSPTLGCYTPSYGGYWGGLGNCGPRVRVSATVSIRGLHFKIGR